MWTDCKEKIPFNFWSKIENGLENYIWLEFLYLHAVLLQAYFKGGFSSYMAVWKVHRMILIQENKPVFF